MMRFQPKLARTLRTLGRRLDALRYDLYLRCARRSTYFVEPLPPYEPTSRPDYFALGRTPPESWVALRLLFYGETLSRDEVDAALGVRVVDGLLELGLLAAPPAAPSGPQPVTPSLPAAPAGAEGDSIRADGYRIVALDGLYFIIGNRKADSEQGSVYIGNESYLLAHCVPPRTEGRVLDLCAGSGIQGIRAVVRGASGVAVELQPGAYEAARCNAVLNDVEKRLEVRQGDLWTPVGDETFDLVLANPPYVSAPAEMSLPVYASGGEDGLKVVLRILDELPAHLKPQGRAMLVFEIPGSGSDTVLTPLLERWIGDQKDLRAELVLTQRMTVSRAAVRRPWVDPMIRYKGLARSPQVIEEQTDAFCAFFADRGYDHFYRCLLFLDRGIRLGEDRLRVTGLYDPVEATSRPRLNPAVRLLAVGKDQYALAFQDGQRMEIPESMYFLLGCFDGNRSIEEVAQAFHGRYGEAQTDVEMAVGKVLETCRAFVFIETLVLEI